MEPNSEAWLCDIRRLNRAMEPTNNEFNEDLDFELDELETWDSDDVREELEELQPEFDLGEAA
jgi:hypothetical protein